MVAMPPWPNSSTRRYRPPSTSPRAATIRLPSSAAELVRSRVRGLEVQAPQVGAELRAQVRPGKRELDGGLQPAHGRPGIVASPIELVAVDRLLFHERLDRVRELDLASGAVRRLLQLVEDLRRQHVAADDGEVRWRRAGRGLLH